MINLYHGDCLMEHEHIEDGSVDLILTDLPYEITSLSWDTIIPLKEMWDMFYRTLRPNGFIVLTASQPFTTKLIASNMDNFSHQWIWKKEQGTNPLLANKIPMKNFEDVVVFSNSYAKHDVENKHPLRDYFKDVMNYTGKTKGELMKEIGQKVDHVFRVNSAQFNLCTEDTYNELIYKYGINKMRGFVEWCNLSKKNGEYRNTLLNDYDIKFPRTYNPQMLDGKEYTSGKGDLKHLGFEMEGGIVSSQRFPTSILEFNTDKRNGYHPTSKPVELMEYLIKTYSNKGDMVADFTMGSGSTGVACVNTNRRFTGVEMDAEYFDIASKRIKDVKKG